MLLPISIIEGGHSGTSVMLGEVQLLMIMGMRVVTCLNTTILITRSMKMLSPTLCIWKPKELFPGLSSKLDILGDDGVFFAKSFQ